jgi:hypothetical protein
MLKIVFNMIFMYWKVRTIHRLATGLEEFRTKNRTVWAITYVNPIRWPSNQREAFLVLADSDHSFEVWHAGIYSCSYLRTTDLTTSIIYNKEVCGIVRILRELLDVLTY